MRARILCYGDSNTWGYDGRDRSRFEEDVRWTGRLQRALGDGYTVIEEGLNGRTTVFDDPLEEGLNGYLYLRPCLHTHKPLDLMLLMLGTNDCKQRFLATPQTIAAGIGRLLDKALSEPVWRGRPNILVMAPPPIEPGCETSEVAGEMGICVEKSRALAPLYERAAAERGCAFVDLAPAVSMNHVDYMHMDPESHARVAELLGARIPELL